MKNIEASSTTGGMPVSPALDAALRSVHVHKHPQIVDRRTVAVAVIAAAIAVVATGVAVALVKLIALITDLFYPAHPRFGAWVALAPILGGLVVGLMARYGSKAIRGHGIPEAMENILLNESRIPARITFLKPISAAVAIGTGGPFGAEGPIIATGGAFGSWVGQALHTTAAERKVLLAAGAAAGMTAIFGSPVSAILLAIELLLFEFRPRSFIPVGIAAVVALASRSAFFGTAPMFAMTDLPAASSRDLLLYAGEGTLLGFFSVFVTQSVYCIEDLFEKLPVHWMWWPMIGGACVGVVGRFSPETLGVGYANVDRLLSGDFTGVGLLFFCAMKFVSWSIALGSGTSGGTLAPLFTIGGGVGVLVGSAYNHLGLGGPMDLRGAALVGMASCFAGASRALFTSVLFAFETTRQANGLGPLLAGCAASYFVSALIMRNTIMTEKLARRGHRVPTEYSAEAVG